MDYYSESGLLIRSIVEEDIFNLYMFFLHLANQRQENYFNITIPSIIPRKESY